MMYNLLYFQVRSLNVFGKVWKFTALLMVVVVSLNNVWAVHAALSLFSSFFQRKGKPT